jgi:hypothetical protein
MEQPYVSQTRRRQCQRFSVNFWASVSLFDDTRAKSVVVNNISSRGVGISSWDRLDANEKVRFRIIDGALGERFYRDATIVWADNPGDGLWRAGLDFGSDNKINLNDFAISTGKDVL